ncbi:serine/threonine protein kinase [Actinoplanes friuliensis]|uniref:Putative serine/threonine protein kinase n=1 Tax=Actinoplanes friuliensis DSM 7358 TaxID=1246995 RepID=U5W3V8_9ACTN|nr:serine/threonine-protein kinase [Actinoplanes friuliensis]AGZ43707.1 putative serine/threonine protein kinase [Actinoplanes friuliensis DSM 7358]
MDTAYRVSPLRRGDPERLGEYWLTGRLGSGGMGVVYLATDRDDNYVAIKLVHAALSGDPEFRGRFRSEVDRARQVPSFCTAEVLDADLDHNPPYLVVEYVDGPSLAEVVEERGPLRAAALNSLAVGVATALTGIHGAGVIHRDLKPDNVLLAPGSPKVIDFGIARAFEATSQHTRTDQMVGTVAYMAPERFSSEPGTPLTAAADVFAWGCVVAYAGTGMTPFHGDSPPATAARILTQPPHLGGLPEPLRGLVELSLSKNPEDRPTARELLDMLLGDRPPRRTPVFSPPPDFPYEEPAPVPAGRGRSHRLLAALAVLLVLAGVATVALVLNNHGGVGNPLNTGATRGGGTAAGAPESPADSSTGAPAPETPPPTAPADYTEPAAEPAEEPEEESSPVPVEPTGGEPIIQDPLNQPGQWLDSEIREQNANCFTRGVMKAGRVDRGTYQCVGPDERIEDDFGVEVTTALQSAGSCAAIWFHWDPKAGGQVLRVCQDEMSIAADKADDRRVYGRIKLGNRIALRKSTRIHLVVREGEAQVFRGGKFAGSVPLPDSGPDEGQVLLGLSVEAVDTDPPYTVTFANVDIRSF